MGRIWLVLVGAAVAAALALAVGGGGVERCMAHGHSAGVCRAELWR